MVFHFIDYSADYFVKEGRDVPKRRGGKFVLIEFAVSGAEPEQQYLVFSPKGQSFFHANIVERFCKNRGSLNGRYNRHRDHYGILSPGWSIPGGGMWSVEGGRLLRLFGESKAYGRFDPEGLVEKLLSEPAFSGFEVLTG